MIPLESEAAEMPERSQRHDVMFHSSRSYRGAEGGGRTCRGSPGQVGCLGPCAGAAAVFLLCWPLTEVMNSNPWHQGNQDEAGDCFLLRG